MKTIYVSERHHHPLSKRIDALFYEKLVEKLTMQKRMASGADLSKYVAAPQPR